MRSRIDKLKSLLMLVFLYIYTDAASAVEAAFPKIAFDYSKQTEKISIVVENDSNVSLLIFDSIRSRTVPQFLSVRIETPTGVVMSDNKVPNDGFLSSNVFESLVLVPPVELVYIHPGKKITAEVGLKELLRNTQQFVGAELSNFVGHCLIFKLTIFVDAQLSRSITHQSTPICLSERHGSKADIRIRADQ
jgi:hypothetical protein